MTIESELNALRIELSSAVKEIERLRNVIECASNALRDAVLVSGNNASTNMHFIRKMERSLRE